MSDLDMIFGSKSKPPENKKTDEDSKSTDSSTNQSISQSTNESSRRPTNKSVGKSTPRTTSNVSSKTSSQSASQSPSRPTGLPADNKIVDRPKAFYILERVDKRIDEAVRRLQDQHNIKKADRSIVLNAYLDNDDLWTDAAIDQLVDRVISQLTSRLMG